ncbi:DctP family TRAP transporter solute-binding subunit [Virgibacillus sp. C22-A2]|uniref:DctP family TRAP transporter solute-binding subunit n=1 Tax=Virgibacillus tibetensis TaxID=3042313 RepID=A0ABU6KDR4_9BACI|nr:DctP family TRAP transporter solute-binding subunit [Virgibacillus sp. C22-A2]
MKKFSNIILMGFIVLIAGFLAGCSDASSSDGKTYTITLPHVVPEDQSSHINTVDFKNEVEEKSDGQIKVEIFPNGSLYGSEREIVEAVQLGNAQMAIVGTPSLAGFKESFMVIDLPFIFKTREAAHKAFDGELGERLNGDLEDVGLVGLGIGENGFRHVLNNKQPITKPEDLQGLKLRVMENKLYQDIFNTLGANASPLAFGELYTAMQQGTYDGMDQPVALAYNNKFYEVQDYMSLTGHVYAGVAFVASKEFMDGLPDDLRTIVEEAGQRFAVENRELAFEQDTKYLDELEAEGLEINEVTEEQKEVFLDALQPVYETYEEVLGKDLIDLAQSFNE